MVARRTAAGDFKCYFFACDSLFFQAQQSIFTDKSFVEVDKPLQARFERRSILINITAVQ